MGGGGAPSTSAARQAEVVGSTAGEGGLNPGSGLGSGSGSGDDDEDVSSTGYDSLTTDPGTTTGETRLARALKMRERSAVLNKRVEELTRQRTSALADGGEAGEALAQVRLGEVLRAEKKKGKLQEKVDKFYGGEIFFAWTWVWEDGG